MESLGLPGKRNERANYDMAISIVNITKIMLVLFRSKRSNKKGAISKSQKGGSKGFESNL